MHYPKCSGSFATYQILIDVLLLLIVDEMTIGQKNMFSFVLYFHLSQGERKTKCKYK